MEMTIDRKGLKLGIKNGFGFKEFQEKYGMDKEQMQDAVMALYKNNKDDAERLLRDISKNEKKRIKECTKLPVTEYKGVPISEIKNMSLDEFMALESDDKPKEEIPGKILLENEIHDLEEQAVKLETERKRWLTKHHNSAEEMGKLEEELESLREKIVALKRKYNTIAERDAKIVAKANEALEKQHEVKAELEEKRRKLDEMLKIVICAYTDGTIAPMDESVTVNLDDTGADILYQELVNREECQELKMREIRTLSKLLKIVENSTLEFEVVCDTAEMEAAYHALTVSADSAK